MSNLQLLKTLPNSKIQTVNTKIKYSMLYNLESRELIENLIWDILHSVCLDDFFHNNINSTSCDDMTILELLVDKITFSYFLNIVMYPWSIQRYTKRASIFYLYCFLQCSESTSLIKLSRFSASSDAKNHYGDLLCVVCANLILAPFMLPVYI